MFFKRVSDRFSDPFSRFSNHFSYRFKSFSGAISFCTRAALSFWYRRSVFCTFVLVCGAQATSAKTTLLETTLSCEAPIHKLFWNCQKPGNHPDFRKNALGAERPFSELWESSGVFSEQLSELEIPFSECEIPFSEWPLTT